MFFVFCFVFLSRESSFKKRNVWKDNTNTSNRILTLVKWPVIENEHPSLDYPFMTEKLKLWVNPSNIQIWSNFMDYFPHFNSEQNMPYLNSYPFLSLRYSSNLLYAYIFEPRRRKQKEDFFSSLFFSYISFLLLLFISWYGMNNHLKRPMSLPSDPGFSVTLGKFVYCKGNIWVFIRAIEIQTILITISTLIWLWLPHS